MPRKLIFAVALFLTLFQPLSACWIWAVSAKSGLTLSELSEYDKTLIYSELQGLFQQSQYAPDGWALLGYSLEQSYPLGLLQRSEIPAYMDSAAFWSTAGALLEESAGKLGLGHVRAASSGASGIPNPHPWLFTGSQTYSLVHGGTVSKNMLYNLITDSGNDLSWLTAHPPQTFGVDTWQDSSGWANVVDSELILLFIMQQVELQGTILMGLEAAFSSLLAAGVAPGQLNIVFSDGYNLFVFGGAGGLSIAETESHIVVMTSPPGEGEAASLDWTGLGNGELLVIGSDGISSYPDFAGVTGEDPPAVPAGPWLLPAYPNPFNGAVTIRFDLTHAQRPILIIHDLLGATVFRTEIPARSRAAGTMAWIPRNPNGQSLPSGTYLVRIQADNGYDSQKILFIK